MSIRAVGFDIDGTLYANWQMYLFGMVPAFRDLALLRAFGKARKQVRDASLVADRIGSDLLSGRSSLSPEERFDRCQAGFVLEDLGLAVTEESVTAMVSRIDRSIYSPWERGFRHVRPLPFIVECMKDLKETGFSIGLLSDFPLAEKARILGVAPFVDASCSSGESGALKPDQAPFLLLAQNLGVQPEEMVYVGNSLEKDIEGARAVGMRTAWYRSRVVRSVKRETESERRADIVFSDYRRLAGEIRSLV